MNDEQAFNTFLDANPTDHHARQVFADFLQDRSDPRAPGYRKLGKLEKYPMPMSWSADQDSDHFIKFIGFVNLAQHPDPDKNSWHPCALPNWWLSLVKQRPLTPNEPNVKYFRSRQEAEEAAAQAFALITKITETPIHAIEVKNPTKSQRLEGQHESEVFLTKFQVVLNDKLQLRWKPLERIKKANRISGGTTGWHYVTQLAREFPTFLANFQYDYDHNGKLDHVLTNVEFITHYNVTQRQLNTLAQILK